MCVGGGTIGAVSGELTASEALGLRMRNLVLAAEPPVDAPTLDGVGALARWFGAMQAQDFASIQWSLGARLPGWTVSDVDAALEAGEALRTWPMRGTIHLVPTEDAAWMVRVFGEKPLAGAVKRREYLGLSEADADRAVELLDEALADGGRLTRSDCIAVLDAGGVSGAGQRGYHLLWYASQRGVTCIGPTVDGEQTFVRLDDWAAKAAAPVRDLPRDAALTELASRYFRSHGPAPRKDFAGWAGITATDAKAGIAGCGDLLTTVTVEGVEMVVSSAALGDGVGAASDEWVAISGFDEYLLGYKDRALMASADEMAAVIPGGNGVFRSTLVRGGRVMATWKRTLTAKAAKVEVIPLHPVPKTQRKRAEAALQPYADFVGRNLTVAWP